MTYLKISKNWTLAIITTVSVVALTYFVFSSIQGTDKNIERSANKTQTAQEGNPTETSTTETETSTSNKTLIAQEEIPTETPLAKTMKPSTNKPSHSKNEKSKNTTSKSKITIETNKTTNKSPTKKPNIKRESVISAEPKAVDPRKTFTDKEGFLLDHVFYTDVLPSISDSHPYALKEGINFESGYYYSIGKNRCAVSMGTKWGQDLYLEYTEVDEQNIIFVEKNEYLTSEGCDFIKGLPPMTRDKIIKSGIHVGGMDVEVGNYQVIVGGFYIVGDSLKDYARGNFNLDSEKGASRGTILKIEKEKVYRFAETFVLKKID